ncbi:hypothetical protein DCAR_0206185 [Daucus carota subsp. sativus]|uniref:DDE Tnp4 domain-containing protein n=1 Tax=Daucus carota subsp. sativus TaxID=79200 RepID=A0AAF0WDV1_DAUCS|nr:hypothetical protein DCAR_0206185 [Daucus carota subsp. sativus]
MYEYMKILYKGVQKEISFEKKSMLLFFASHLIQNIFEPMDTRSVPTQLGFTEPEYFGYQSLIFPIYFIKAYYSVRLILKNIEENLAEWQTVCTVAAYTLVCGLCTQKRYMASYKGSCIQYHIQDFRRANGTARHIRNTKEKFNHLHSSCKMVIERTFGVWKARFAILANMPMYKIITQTNIVLTTMTIHNHIRKSRITDNAFDTVELETYIPENATSAPNPSQ